MSEIDSSVENIKIPENWKFPERDHPKLKVRQIDLDQRFIAFDLSKDPLDVLSKPQYGDYFFDGEGNSLIKRIYHEQGVMGIPSTYIDLFSDQEIDYRFDGGLNFFDYRGRSPIKGGVSVFFEEESLVDKKETLLIEHFLGGVYYEGQRLDSIDFGYNFSTDPNRGRRLYVPSMALDLIRGLDLVLDPKNRQNKEFFFEEFDNLEPQRKQNGAVYLDKNGDKIFQVEWKLEEDESDPSRGMLVATSQTHIPSGIVKTLRAPLRLDMGKVKEAVFSRPPYQKDERGILVVPWTNIGRIVDASLSYSYPPPTPQK